MRTISTIHATDAGLYCSSNIKINISMQHSGLTASESENVKLDMENRIAKLLMENTAVRNVRVQTKNIK